MNQGWILYPMFAMVLLTLLVAVRMLLLRIRSVRDGTLRLSYFRTNQGGDVPERLTRTTQHFDNLFEMPILFYIIVMVLFTTKTVGLLELSLAWAYVVLRVGHAFVHITYNNVIHRLYVFLASTLVMFAMWCTWFGKSFLI